MLQPLCDRLLHDGTVTFVVRVQPGSKVTAIKTILADGSVRVGVHTKAEDGKANKTLQRLLADEFGVKPQHVEILVGHTSRMKTVRITLPV